MQNYISYINDLGRKITYSLVRYLNRKCKDDHMDTYFYHDNSIHSFSPDYTSVQLTIKKDNFGRIPFSVLLTPNPVTALPVGPSDQGTSSQILFL